MTWCLQLGLLLVAVGLAYWWLSGDKLDTLKGKRVLVTGSSDGIGEQIAYHYARLGARVVVTGRRVEKLNKVLKECQTLSPSPSTKHFAVPADMSVMTDTNRLIEEATKHLGGLDILVLNHIKPIYRGTFTGTVEDLEENDSTMNINFRSYVYLTAHALPQLIANNGSIIVVNSVGGITPQLHSLSYGSSKHALIGFFHSLRSQFVSKGQDVSVTTCILGLIGSDRVLTNLKKSKESILKDYIIKPASPKATALDIVKGGARRQREVFTPYLATRFVPFLYSLFPNFLDGVFRYAVSVFDH